MKNLKIAVNPNEYELVIELAEKIGYRHDLHSEVKDNALSLYLNESGEISWSHRPVDSYDIYATKHQIIDVADLKKMVDELNPNPENLDQYDYQNHGKVYEIELAKMEKSLLDRTLVKFCGNQNKTAAYLGLNRATLRNKLQKYGFYKGVQA